MSLFKRNILDESTLNAQTPQLNSAGKTNPFKVPDGYFENFQQNIIQQVQFIPQPSPIQSFFRNFGTTVLNPQFAAAASVVLIIAVSALIYFSDMGFSPPPLSSNQSTSPETIIRINPDLPANTLYTASINKSNDQHQVIIEVSPEATPEKIKSSVADYPAGPQIIKQIDQTIDQHFAANNSLNPTEKPSSDQQQLPPGINNSTYSPTYNAQNYPQYQNIYQGSQYSVTPYNPVNNSSQNTSVNNQTVHQDGNNTVNKKPDHQNTTNKLPYFALPEYVCSETTYELQPYEKSSKYKYIWSTGEKTPSIQVRSSGTYTLTIYSIDNPEEYTTSTSVVRIIPKPQNTLPTHTILCSGQTLTLDPKIENEDNYSYFWIPTYDTIKNIDVKHQGLYVLAITGCNTYFDSVLVTREHCDILVPNVITPNNDGINDYFYIHGLEKYSSTMLTIYDRNGRIVFTSNDYQNDWTGDKLSDGSYYFVLRFSDGLEKHGSLTILK
jgi:gliding motility-associated-like protein